MTFLVQRCHNSMVYLYLYQNAPTHLHKHYFWWEKHLNTQELGQILSFREQEQNRKNIWSYVTWRGYGT